MEITDIITRLHEVVKNAEKKQNKKPDKRFQENW